MGYASQVKDDDVGGDNEFYLPHHGVYKNTISKRKLRVVFDSAAAFNGKCLNDALITGPKLLNDLPTVLVKFREGAIAVTSDREAMFSRIRMTKQDARYHRFLWKPPGSEKIITYQMDRVTFGNCCSSFFAIYATRRAADDFGNGRNNRHQGNQRKLVYG